MVLDECPKLTKDKKIISNSIDVPLYGQEGQRLNLAPINQKPCLELYKVDYLKILE